MRPEPETRIYVRCQHCLAVSMIHYRDLPGNTRVHKGNPLPATCGICGGPIESMGAVDDSKAKLRSDRLECLCDERCATAAGPSCSCRCGGKNHGAKMEAYVVRSTYEALPTITPPGDATRCLERAAEFRAALEAAEQHTRANSRDYQAWQDKLAGRWTDHFSGYQRIKAMRDMIWDAKHTRTHKSRLEKLARVLTR